MKIVPREEVSADEWDAFVEAHGGGWFWHTTRWCHYSRLYTPGAVDDSFAIRSDYDGTLVGLVPLIHAGTKLVHGGQITPAPIFQARAETMQAITTLALPAAVERLGADPLPIQMRPGATPKDLPPEHFRTDLASTYVVDLRRPEAYLWRGIRKSYKSLIHRAEETHDLTVLRRAWAVEVARQLHDEVAGGETRSKETWRLMGDWAETGYVVTAVAMDRLRRPRGYALVICYKGWAYYASAATLDDNLQHALQWHVMQTLKRDVGIRAYEIGYAATDHSTEKEQGIAHFKAGFGGEVLKIYVVSPVGWRPTA